MKPVPRKSRSWVLFAAILASSMAFIDGTALNVALPALQDDLKANGTQLLWIVNAYALLLSSLILAGGLLGDSYGRKRVFAAGIGVFSLASLGAGLAPSVPALIGARALQGVGAALMIPGSLALIAAAYPAGDRGRAIGTWSAATTVTTILGPVLGGYLAEIGWWRAVFFLNLPLGVLSLYSLSHHADSSAPTSRRPNLGGSLLVAGALGSLTYGAIAASQRSLADPVPILALALGTLGFILFPLFERRAEQPLIPESLIHSRTFVGVNILTFLLYSALYSTFFFFSLTLIQGQGYPANLAGLALVPFSVLLTLLSRWAGGLADRLGPRLPLIVGPALTGLGFLLLGLPEPGVGAGSYWSTYFPGIAAVGVGMGLTVAPLSTAVMTSAPDEHVGSASGINNAVSRVAQVLSIAVVGSLALVGFRQGLVLRAHSLGLSPQATAALQREAAQLGAASPPAGLSPDLEGQVENAIRAQMVDTFRWIALGGAILALLGAVATAVWVGPARSNGVNPISPPPASDR